MDKLTDSSGRTTNGTVLPTLNFGKKGITPDVFFFCRFYQNDQNITEPFASAHLRTMLLGEIRGLFAKLSSGKNCSIRFDLAENSHRFSHTNGKRSTQEPTFLVFCVLNCSSRWVSLFLQMVLDVCRMKARACQVIGV